MILPKGYSPIAYFSAEFAIDNELPTYAGGLGILAGDFINAAASMHYPVVGIGILYRGRNFVQHITHESKEEKRDTEFDHDTSFLRHTTVAGKQLVFSVHACGEEVKVKAYHLRLSDESMVIFLSTDVDGNPEHWRRDMDTLYAGDTQSQLRQQTLLGVGGAKLLDILKIRPAYYHINEGRPAFLIWELAREMVAKGMSFQEAWAKAKEKIVYTNHTLVAAGNPSYDFETVKAWAAPFAAAMGVSDPYELVRDGHEGDHFSITRFALNISTRQNAVSKVHGRYCRKHFPDYKWEAITNGVHLPRWQDSDFRNPSMSDDEIWDLHMAKKRELLSTVVNRTGISYDPNRLVVTWARRLADYKQPKVIFQDIERLKGLVSSSERPVQILFAGNSHAADPGGKKLIEEIIEIFAGPLSGHAIFVPNYNISLANHLVSGSDIWLNTPKGNLEACGTSGMKAISNGVLNCTVLDGWTYEVKWDGIGWTLSPENAAVDFYNLLEQEIAPLYYDRNERGVPLAWVDRMRKSIILANKFSAENMLGNYIKKLYK